LHNKIYDFVCTNAKRKDRVLRKKSLEIFLRSLHPKNPRLRERPIKLRTQKIAKAIFVPQKCYAFKETLGRFLNKKFF